MRMSEEQIEKWANDRAQERATYDDTCLKDTLIEGYHKAISDSEAWVDVETILRDLLNRIGSEEHNGYVKFNAVDEIIEEVIAFNKHKPKQAEAANE